MCPLPLPALPPDKKTFDDDNDKSRLAESYHIILIKDCLILISFGVMRAVQTIAPTDIPDDTKYIISRYQCNPLQSIWIFFTK